VPSFILSGAPFFRYSGTKLGALAERSASKSSRPAFDYFIYPVAPELVDATAYFRSMIRSAKEPEAAQ
jgi:hypothetical protein